MGRKLHWGDFQDIVKGSATKFIYKLNDEDWVSYKMIAKLEIRVEGLGIWIASTAL